MKYDIYFSIYGKKLKATIEASSQKEAEYLLRGKIKIEKIEESSEQKFDDMMGNPLAGVGIIAGRIRKIKERKAD